MTRSERFVAAVLADDPAALEALATLRMLPSPVALALLRYLADELDSRLGGAMEMDGARREGGHPLAPVLR